MRTIKVSPHKRMGVSAVQWRGDNEDEVFDFARPLVFRDYTKPETPLIAKTSSGEQRVSVGEWLEVWEGEHEIRS